MLCLDHTFAEETNKSNDFVGVWAARVFDTGIFNVAEIETVDEGVTEIVGDAVLAIEAQNPSIDVEGNNSVPSPLGAVGRVTVPDTHVTVSHRYHISLK